MLNFAKEISGFFDYMFDLLPEYHAHAPRHRAKLFCDYLPLLDCDFVKTLLDGISEQEAKEYAFWTVQILKSVAIKLHQNPLYFHCVARNQDSFNFENANKFLHDSFGLLLDKLFLSVPSVEKLTALLTIIGQAKNQECLRRREERTASFRRSEEEVYFRIWLLVQVEKAIKLAINRLQWTEPTDGYLQDSALPLFCAILVHSEPLSDQAPQHAFALVTGIPQCDVGSDETKIITKKLCP